MTVNFIQCELVKHSSMSYMEDRYSSLEVGRLLTAHFQGEGKGEQNMLARICALGDLDRLEHQLAQTTTPAGTVIPTDAWRDDETLYLQFDLPGMARSSIEVTTERDTLTLSAERLSPVPAGARPLLSERPTGRFTRRLTLSDALDTTAAEATYDNGVLTLRIPLAAHAKPRKIAISGGTPRQLTA